MTIVPIVPKAIARFGSSRARTAWKACGQSLPALFAGVLFRAGIDHILSTLSARRRTANVPALRRSDKYGLRGYGPAWPRRQASTAGSAPVRNSKKRSHASGLDRGASNAKPGLDMPGRICRTIGTLLGSSTPRSAAKAGSALRAEPRQRSPFALRQSAVSQSPRAKEWRVQPSSATAFRSHAPMSAPNRR